MSLIWCTIKKYYIFNFLLSREPEAVLSVLEHLHFSLTREKTLTKIHNSKQIMFVFLQNTNIQANNTPEENLYSKPQINITKGWQNI